METYSIGVLESSTANSVFSVPPWTCITSETSAPVISMTILVITSANPQGHLCSCTVRFQFLTISMQYISVLLFLPRNSFTKTYPSIFPQERCCSHMPDICLSTTDGTFIMFGATQNVWTPFCCLGNFPQLLSCSGIWWGADPGFVGLGANTIFFLGGSSLRKKQQNMNLKLD